MGGVYFVYGSVEYGDGCEECFVCGDGCGVDFVVVCLSGFVGGGVYDDVDCVFVDEVDDVFCVVFLCFVVFFYDCDGDVVV